MFTPLEAAELQTPGILNVDKSFRIAVLQKATILRIFIL